MREIRGEAMTGSSNAGATLTGEAIREWMVTRLAEDLGVYPEEIGVEEELSEFGLDSVATLRLRAQLEAFIGRTVPVSVLYKYSTIDALSRYLAQSESR
jgi:acyl carrier protein